MDQKDSVGGGFNGCGDLREVQIQRRDRLLLQGLQNIAPRVSVTRSRLDIASRAEALTFGTILLPDGYRSVRSQTILVLWRDR